MKSILNRFIIDKNQHFKDTLDHLHELTVQVNYKEYEQVVEELKERVETPFTFVIVGEVKAGKSSFVNALLDVKREICKVAPSPMTDTIQQILYGEDDRIEVINPYRKRIYLPVDILQEISIVDTPGTNTIAEHHQEITEKFIPFSDLIVFVFEAKNPYRQSAWNFFDYIHEDWRKKVIFILQQKDLMKEDDLNININGVHDYAKERGIDDPKVFAVSALQEQEGKKDISGFKALRSFLQENITGGQAPQLKLENNISTALQINNTLGESIKLRYEQYKADADFRDEIKLELQEQAERSMGQAKQLVDVLSASYQTITNEKIDRINDELALGKVLKRSFRSMITSEVGLKEWLSAEAKDLEYKLNLELKDKLNTGIIDVADQIQNMIRMIDLKLKTSKTILNKNHEIFADIAEHRNLVLRELQASFSDFMQKSENFYDENTQESTMNLAPNLAAGGGLAVVGVILTTLTNGAVFDITGGILTTVGVLFAGVSLGWQRTKLQRNFKKEMKAGRVKLEQDVQEKLEQYIQGITQKMESIFNDFDQYLTKEKTEVDALVERQNTIEKRLKKISD